MALTQDEYLALPAKRRLAMAMAEKVRRKRENRLTAYAPYQKQRDFHGTIARERLFMAGNQLGKAQPTDEMILTPSGWRPIGALAVGDQVIAGDGTVTVVTGVYPQGVKPIYRLVFDRGEAVRCCAEHLWQVTLPSHRYRTRVSHGELEPNPGYGRQTVVKTADLIERYGKSMRPKGRVEMPVVGCVQFPEREVPLDPYLLGALLGNGCLRNGSVGFSTADHDTLREVSAALPPRHHIRQSSRYDWQIISEGASYCAKTGRYLPRNAVKTALTDLGVYGHLSYDKFVPAEYLINSPRVRLAVLQGLMDTDGSVCIGGAIEFSSSSQRLAEDVVFLVRSFGGKAGIAQRETRFTGRDGEKKSGARSYRVRIRLPQVTPFRLQRKAERLVRPVSTCDEHVLHAIEPAGESEAVCISVAHPSRLYVTTAFIVTHNTISGGYEAAIHATGLYPDWWTGHRFTKPITGWASGVTSESVRDTVQRILLGRPGEHGTGSIPKALIIEAKPARGIPDAIDTVTVRHVSGGVSRISFKSYEKGREKWQGETLDFVWFDEEPPADIYTEGLTRTNATAGITWMTFTPLLGVSEVVRRFIVEKPAGTAVISMTINDVDHYTAEQKLAIVASYPPHEREARAKGIPTLGSGRIFPVTEESITTPRIAIPAHWPQIGGLDFGWDHPTAAVRLAWDRDNDIVYVTATHRLREATPLLHAAALKAWGDWLPWAWPHDGLQHDKGSGEQLADQYRKHGLDMLPERATFEDGGNGVEAGVMQMLDRMQTGQLLVFSDLADWFEEFRLYHRKAGKIVKANDDILSATRYGLMMLRHARVKPGERLASRRRANWKVV